jgi:hypothetical protein
VDALAEFLVGDEPPSRGEVDEAGAVIAASLDPVAPSPAARGRLLHDLGTADRFAPFLADLTRLFELPVESVRKLLARIDGRQWENTLLGVQLLGAELFHFPVGPQLAAGGAAGGVVRVRPDVTFPAHRHHGDETTYVLEGGYRLDGRVLGPGSVIEMAAGSTHDYRSAPGRDLVMMVLHRGITILAG